METFHIPNKHFSPQSDFPSIKSDKIKGYKWSKSINDEEKMCSTSFQQDGLILCFDISSE